MRAQSECAANGARVESAPPRPAGSPPAGPCRVGDARDGLRPPGRRRPAESFLQRFIPALLRALSAWPA